jgi:hypothetical protein
MLCILLAFVFTYIIQYVCRINMGSSKAVKYNAFIKILAIFKSRNCSIVRDLAFPMQRLSEYTVRQI